jgi:hypothetical protein
VPFQCKVLYLNYLQPVDVAHSGTRRYAFSSMVKKKSSNTWQCNADLLQEYIGILNGVGHVARDADS